MNGVDNNDGAGSYFSSLKFDAADEETDFFWQAPDYKGEIAKEGPRGPKGYKGADGYPG